MFKIGIVAEGVCDQTVIKELLSSYLQENHGINANFINLQPSPDKTSSSSTDGGWEQVYKWCTLNPPNERLNFFDEGLFSDDLDAFKCDLIIIHMDSDICEKTSKYTSISPIPTIEDNANTRGHFVKLVLNEWLWPENHADKSRHILAVAVESIECWLVAGLINHENPESDRDIQRKLAILDHQIVRNRPAPESVQKPKKSAKNYEKICKVAVRNMSRIIETCPHFKELIVNTDSSIKYLTSLKSASAELSA